NTGVGGAGVAVVTRATAQASAATVAHAAALRTRGRTGGRRAIAATSGFRIAHVPGDPGQGTVPVHGVLSGAPGLSEVGLVEGVVLRGVGMGGSDRVVHLRGVDGPTGQPADR